MNIKATYRKIQDWYHWVNERMKQPAALLQVDHSHHICSHCGYGYDGRCCPQCGMPAGHHRFTFKRLIQNFLDIWGMGNRPMFRTMCDLLWRPGYMIRDYLGGHHLSYFPPFKMLAVFTVFIVFLTWIFDLQDPLVAEKIADGLLKLKEVKGVKEYTARVIDFLAEAFIYLDKNDLYRILIQNIFVVMATWLVFRRKGYNLVETFFSQIYINCQFHMIAIVIMLVTMKLPPTFIMPYYVPIDITFLLLVIDYKQLYGISFWGAIWRTALIFVITIIVYALLFVMIISSAGAFDKVVEVTPQLVG